MKPTAKLRELLENNELIVAPSCFNPMIARMAEKIGFQVIYVGGYAIGATTAVTEPLLTLDEMVTSCRYIASAVKVPVVADAGAGFGDPLHVTRTVKEFERAGVAGIHIEDQVYPKRASYHRDYKEHVISQEEMCLKVKYACEARDDPNFLIIARTDSMKTHGFDEAVKRANTYAKAGADMVMLFPNNLKETAEATKRIKIPLVYVNSEGNRVGRPVLSVREAKEYGYRMLIDAISSTISCYQGVEAYLKSLKSDGISGLDRTKTIATRKEIESVIGLPEYWAIEDKTTERR